MGLRPAPHPFLEFDAIPFLAFFVLSDRVLQSFDEPDLVKDLIDLVFFEAFFLGATTPSNGQGYEHCERGNEFDLQQPLLDRSAASTVHGVPGDLGLLWGSMGRSVAAPGETDCLHSSRKSGLDDLRQVLDTRLAIGPMLLIGL
jgi:hypothetical protein